MNGHYITAAELVTVLGLGALAPWLIAASFQVYVYVRQGVPSRYIAISIAMTLVLVMVVGGGLWVVFPELHIEVKGFEVVPFVPMIISAFIVVPSMVWAFSFAVPRLTRK
ncbi:MAG: hypothetical protein ACQES2_06665 [Pseudomonadota bacterium]